MLEKGLFEHVCECVIFPCSNRHLQGTLNNESITLAGYEIAYSRFGSSVVNIGDVNDDGYEGRGLVELASVGVVWE